MKTNFAVAPTFSRSMPAKSRLYIYFASIAILLLLQIFEVEISTSQPRITSVIQYQKGNSTSGTGRDYWVSMCQNYDNQPGKFYALYVTSPHATTVNIQVTGGTTSKFPITAGQVVTFMIPLSWEITNSGSIEDKGIHIWSNDDDLIVNLLSRNPASSDGMFVIPTTGWGKEYVVGAYGSLFEGASNDYPSEFSIVANQDNTICTISPNCDIRMSDGSAAHKAHVPFAVVLNKGQCIQYKAVQATSCDNFDVTGTIITSNNSIGVVGASMCPNIPCDYQYCDHICDMIPPVRTWGKTYQTIPFDQRLKGDTYLVITSKAGQVINRNGTQYFISKNKYDFYFRPDISDASQWTSDAPFMLAQYINSSTWESPSGSIGDPAMVVINSVEEYTPHIIFETPYITTNGFTNFANVMAKSKTTFDGRPIGSISGVTQMSIPGSNYTAFRVPHVQPGKHEVRSDSGVGIYVYGYGSYDSYAWSGNLGIATFNDPDTIPPKVVTSGNCFDALVTITDNHKSPPASKISTMKIDSVYNMSYNPDPNYTEGIERDSTFYNMAVIDKTKEAYLSIETFDYAGNRTTIISTYKPQLVKFSSNPLNFGSVSVGNFSFLYDTICNTGQLPFHFKKANLVLSNGTQIDNFGFSIDSVGSDGDIPIGGCRIIKLHFVPNAPPTVRDTMMIVDTCSKIICPLVGNGGVPDFALSDFNFGCIDLGKVSTVNATVASNFGAGAITIDSIWTDDPVHFTFSGTPKLPATIKVNDQLAFEFTFTPTTKDSICTTVHFRSSQSLERTAKLCGCGQFPASVETHTYSSSLSKGSVEYSLISAKLDHGDDLVILPPVPNPLLHGENSIRFDYGLKFDSQSGLAIYDILGNLVVSVLPDGFQNAGIYEINFQVPSKMTSGSYIYRLFGAGRVLSGKLVVSK